MVLAYVLAQAAVAAVAQPATPPPAQTQGVISYPASFFAGQQVANASEMLTRVPGFSLDTGSSVRGFEGAAGNVLVDGQRPTSKTDNLEEILRRIPVGQVERIDIVRGGAPGIDMQGKTIIANVIRKSGATFHGMFAAANFHLWDGRNMHGMRLELGGGDGTRTWEATARYGYGNDDGGSDGPLRRIQADGTISRFAKVRAESDGLQQTLTAAYSQPFLGGRIAVNGRAFWDSWKSEETDTYFDPPSLGKSVSTDPYDDFQTEVGARFNRDFGPRHKLEIVGLRTDRDYHAFDLFTFGPDVSDFRQKRDESETILRGVLKRQQAANLSLEVGAEGAINKLDSRQADFENGVEVQIPAANVQVEEKRGEAFVKGTWRASPKWTVDASVRYEASRITSDGDVVLEKSLSFVKPRLAVTWDQDASRQIRLRLEREVGQLNFDDFVAGANFNTGQGISAGNPDLDPEQAWVAEAALEQRFWKGAAATVAYRHYELSDVIDRGPVFLPRLDGGRPVLDDQGRPIIDVFDQPDNIGDGTKDELTVNLTLPSDHFGWKGGLLRGELNKRWSKVTDPTTHTSRRISRQRPLEWELHYSQDVPRHGLSYGFDLFSGWDQISYRFNYISQVKLENSYLVTFVEKRLNPTLVLRMEYGNWTRRGIRIATRVYDGPRDRGSLAYIDDRELTPGHAIYFRLRKTFGS